MPSSAYGNLTNRLKDIELLLTAHAQVIKLKRAEQATQQASGSLAQTLAALTNLVGPISRGRPAEVGAINRGAFVLLSAHLEGFGRSPWGSSQSPFDRQDQRRHCVSQVCA